MLRFIIYAYVYEFLFARNMNCLINILKDVCLIHYTIFVIIDVITILCNENLIESFRRVYTMSLTTYDFM